MSASSGRFLARRKRGLSGKNDIAKQAINSGIEQTAKNILHEFISSQPLKRFQLHDCGIINQARPEKKQNFLG